MNEVLKLIAEGASVLFITTASCALIIAACAKSPDPTPAPQPQPICYLTDDQGNILTDDQGNRLTCN